MKERLLKVVIKIVGLLVLLFVYYFLSRNFGFSIPCPIHYFTGYYCPGCGITRCLFSLIQLDFSKAFRYNQLVFILIPFFVFYYGYSFYIYIFNKEDKVLCKIPKYVWIILLIITILFGIIRNLDGFEFLRP